MIRRIQKFHATYLKKKKSQNDKTVYRVKKLKKKKIDPKKRKTPHLASTSFFSYRFPSIPEEEKWADV